MCEKRKYCQNHRNNKTNKIRILPLDTCVFIYYIDTYWFDSLRLLWKRMVVWLLWKMAICNFSCIFRAFFHGDIVRRIWLCENCSLLFLAAWGIKCQREWDTKTRRHENQV